MKKFRLGIYVLFVVAMLILVTGCDSIPEWQVELACNEGGDIYFVSCENACTPQEAIEYAQDNAPGQCQVTGEILNPNLDCSQVEACPE